MNWNIVSPSGWTMVQVHMTSGLSVGLQSHARCLQLPRWLTGTQFSVHSIEFHQKHPFVLLEPVLHLLDVCFGELGFVIISVPEKYTDVCASSRYHMPYRCSRLVIYSHLYKWHSIVDSGHSSKVVLCRPHVLDVLTDSVRFFECFLASAKIGTPL